MEHNSNESFDNILLSTGRANIESLINWLHTTDFYTAPASSKFHGACERGLIIHSLTVFDSATVMNRFLGLGCPDDSIAISALLHDVCKAHTYTIDFKNVKKTDPDTGNYEWVKEPYYKFDEKFPFGGHGSKSVYLVSKHIDLRPEEGVAINCHMGFSDTTNISSISKAYETYKLAWLIHAADEMATFIYKQ